MQLLRPGSSLPSPDVGCGHGQPLFRCESAQSHIGAFVIVRPHPARGVFLHVLEVFPLVLRQPFVSGRPVEPLDIGVLLRLAGLDEIEPDAPLLRPGQSR